MKLQFDKLTSRWMSAHPGQPTTVVQCSRCGLYYKPFLGHLCTGRNRIALDGGGRSRTEGLSAEDRDRDLT